MRNKAKSPANVNSYSPAEHMKAIIIYYKALKDITTITSFKDTENYRTLILADLGQPLVAQAKAIRHMGKQYLKELPNYDEPDFWKASPADQSRS